MGSGGSSSQEVGAQPHSSSGGGSTGEDGGVGNDNADELFARVEVTFAGDTRTNAEGVPICSVCGREGHSACGLRYWISLRSAWLRASEDDVSQVPASFEDAGTLQLARADDGPIRELSEGELEDLEDCLDAVQRPFPRLRRTIPLMQVVQCAETLWDQDD